MESKRVDLRSRIPIIVVDYFMLLLLLLQAANVLYHLVVAFLEVLRRPSMRNQVMLLFTSIVMTTTFTILFMLFVYLPQRSTTQLLASKAMFRRVMLVTMVISVLIVISLSLMTDGWVLFWIFSYLVITGLLISTLVTAFLRIKRTFVRKPLSVIIKAHVSLFLQLLRFYCP